MKSLLSSFIEIMVPRVFGMPIFLLIGRHSPENCPMFNEKARKVWTEYFSKEDGLLKKHGVKSLGSWIVGTEHLSVGVFEAPSLDAFEKLGMEPQVLALTAYMTYEIKLALSMEEVAKMLRQAK
jgi:hypothetical protein